MVCKGSLRGFYLVLLTIITLDAIDQRIDLRILPVLTISTPYIYLRNDHKMEPWTLCEMVLGQGSSYYLNDTHMSLLEPLWCFTC